MDAETFVMIAGLTLGSIIGLICNIKFMVLPKFQKDSQPTVSNQPAIGNTRTKESASLVAASVPTTAHSITSKGASSTTETEDRSKLTDGEIAAFEHMDRELQKINHEKGSKDRDMTSSRLLNLKDGEEIYYRIPVAGFRKRGGHLLPIMSKSHMPELEQKAFQKSSQRRAGESGKGQARLPFSQLIAQKYRSPRLNSPALRRLRKKRRMLRQQNAVEGSSATT